MILTEGTEIRSINCNKKYYQKLGYDVSKQYFKVKIIDLQDNSTILINVKCDVCGNEKNISYRAYIKNTRKHTEDYCCCKKCSSEKSKNRLIEKYGVENIFQLETIKNKSSETKLFKYENKNYINIDKRKETCLLKYGVDEHLKSREIREKIKDTCFKKYGVDSVTKVKRIKNKQESKSKITKFNKSKEYYKNKYNLELRLQEDEEYCFKCEKGHDFFI